MIEPTSAATAATLDHGRACLVVTGAPGAGKSTVSRLVAKALSRSALLDGDDVNRLIVSGRVWALGEPADEAARQVQLCNANLCALAANFADAGFTPIIDSVVPDRPQLDFFREALGARRLLLVVLDPGSEACRHRDQIRPTEEQFFFDSHDSLVAAMRNGFGDLGWWLDSSTVTAEETARHILENVSSRALVEH